MSSPPAAGGLSAGDAGWAPAPSQAVRQRPRWPPRVSVTLPPHAPGSPASHPRPRSPRRELAPSSTEAAVAALLPRCAVSFREQGQGPDHFVTLERKVWEMPQPGTDPTASADARECQGFVLPWPVPADKQDPKRRPRNPVAQTGAVPRGPGRDLRARVTSHRPLRTAGHYPPVTRAIVCHCYHHVYQPLLESREWGSQARSS